MGGGRHAKCHISLWCSFVHEKVEKLPNNLYLFFFGKSQTQNKIWSIEWYFLTFSFCCFISPCVCLFSLCLYITSLRFFEINLLKLEKNYWFYMVEAHREVETFMISQLSFNGFWCNFVWKKCFTNDILQMLWGDWTLENWK